MFFAPSKAELGENATLQRFYKKDGYAVFLMHAPAYTPAPYFLYLELPNYPLGYQVYRYSDFRLANKDFNHWKKSTANIKPENNETPEPPEIA